MPRNVSTEGTHAANKAELTRVGTVTQSMWEGIWMDEFPDSPAALVDFGLDDPRTKVRRLGALQFAVKRMGITPKELEAAICNGPALTELVKHPNQPYPCTFRTAWDGMGPEED